MPKLFRSRLTDIRKDFNAKTTLLKSLLRSSRATTEGDLLPLGSSFACTTGSVSALRRACREMRDVLKEIEKLN